MAEDEALTVKIGVVLDSDSSIGKMGFSFMEMALSDFYGFNRNYKTRLALFLKNSMGDVVEATAAGFNPISYRARVLIFSWSFRFNLFLVFFFLN